MMHYQHILAVSDSQTQAEHVFQKAAILAHLTHARLTRLTIKLSGNRFLKRLLDKSLVKEANTRISLSKATLTHPIKHVTRHASSLHKGVMTELEQDNYDLVILPHKRYHSIVSELVSADEWHLLRETCVPVMFVNGNQWQPQGHILAAIEINHTQAPHLALNDMIIKQSQQLATALSSELHLINCYLEDNISMAFENEDEAHCHSILGQMAQHQLALDQVLANYPLAKRQRHIAQGLPEDAIPSTATQLKTNFVVMGAAEHQGMLSTIKGHVSERVINQIPYDVLAIKPYL
jgi:universal stress protein E